MTALDLGAGLIGAAAITLPGWFVARALRVPQALLAGFIAGAVALVAITIGFDAAGVRLAPRNYFIAWAVLTAGAAAWRGLKRNVPQPTAVTEQERPSPRWWQLVLVPVSAVAMWRATTQPLFGVDTVFRWNFLAEQMLARGTLDFYPPFHPEQHAIYGWPDGIAPLVSAIYFWVYAIAGAARPEATAPVVVLQFALILAGVHALARRYFSAAAAGWACALAACSPLLAWAAAMGQETGLTALALLGLLLWLPGSAEEDQRGTVVLAALAAALGALAREYGLVFPLLGLALAVARRLSPRSIALFALTSLLAAGPWYVRNWLLTGNPIYNLSPGGFFPVNEVHTWLNDSYHAELGWSRLTAEMGWVFVGNGLLALACALAGGALFFRRTSALVIALVVVAGVWAASVGYTAAGFTYSLRVLAPAIAMAAVVGGAVLARWVPAGRATAFAVAGLVVLAGDAALRTLTLPVNVYRLAPRDWPAVGRALHDYHARPVYAELARRIGTERALVLGPHALLVKHGAAVTPLWSPEVRFVFDEKLPPPEIARRLRAAGFGFVLLTQGRVNERFLARSAFFRDPAGALAPVWSDADMVLLRVQSPPP